MLESIAEMRFYRENVFVGEIPSLAKPTVTITASSESSPESS